MYRHIEESQTLLINQQMNEMISNDQDLIRFGFGQSPFLPPQFVIEGLKNSVLHKEYTSVQGDRELRSLIAAFHKAHNGLICKPENILLAPGSKALLFSILMAHEKADVFIAAPAWVSYSPQAKMCDHHLIKIPTSFEDRWRITPEFLKSSLKEKQNEESILILNYPGNPDGLSYTAHELAELAEIFRTEDILVVSDEIYGLLDFNMNHTSLSTIYPEKTITTTGLSKWCGAGGWRLGVAMLYDEIDPDLFKALIGIGSETYSCAPVPVQMAAKEAYKDYNRVHGYLQKRIEVLKQCGHYCTNRLNQSGIRVLSPEGGFYLFPDFNPYQDQLNRRGIYSSNELCSSLLSETGVAMLPATAFGFEDNFLATRLAYVDFEDPFIHDTYEFEKNCSKVIEGANRIADWLSQI